MKYQLLKLLMLTGGTPTFNQAEAQNMVNGFLNPLTAFLIWAIPSVATAASLIVGLKYFGEDEERREQKPLWKRLKPLIIAAVILFSLTAIYRLFGIQTTA